MLHTVIEAHSLLVAEFVWLLGMSDTPRFRALRVSDEIIDIPGLVATQDSCDRNRP
jgi:hypothetical protein